MISKDGRWQTKNNRTIFLVKCGIGSTQDIQIFFYEDGGTKYQQRL